MELNGVFPYRRKSLGIEEEDASSAVNVAVHKECTLRNISDVHTVMHSFWQTKDLSSETLSIAMHSYICRWHGDKNITTVSVADEMDCTAQAFVNTSCLQEKHRRNGSLNSVLFNETSTLILKKTSGSQAPGSSGNGVSYACPNSTVRVDYVFVSADTMNTFETTVNHVNPSMHFEHPVLLTTGVTVVSGQCEPTIHVVGRAALLYGASSEWKSDEFSTMPRIDRYHLFAAAVSSSIFTPETLRPHMPEGERKVSCLIRVVRTASSILVDWRCSVLLYAMVVACFILVAAAVLRCVYCDERWSIGSLHWALSKFSQQAISPTGATAGEFSQRAVSPTSETAGDGCCETWNNPNRMESSVFVDCEDQSRLGNLGSAAVDIAVIVHHGNDAATDEGAGSNATSRNAMVRCCEKIRRTLRRWTQKPENYRIMVAPRSPGRSPGSMRYGGDMQCEAASPRHF